MENDRNDEERVNWDEAQAVIHLWSRRQWERRHWPTVTDIAEGLDISVAEAELLLREARRTHPIRLGSLPFPKREGFFGLTAGVAGLTGVFCLFLSRLLS